MVLPSLNNKQQEITNTTKRNCHGGWRPREKRVERREIKSRNDEVKKLGPALLKVLVVLLSLIITKLIFKF